VFIRRLRTFLGSAQQRDRRRLAQDRHDQPDAQLFESIPQALALLLGDAAATEDGESEAPENGLGDPDTILADLSAEQRCAIVDAALRQLPDHQRLPLVLYHFEDLSYQEIAIKLNVSLTKIKTDIRRARAALLPLLQNGGAARDTLDG